MRYLITGGCGFLGSNLAYDLLKLREELCIFDNLSRHGSIQNLAWLRKSGKFDFRHGDIRSHNDVNQIVAIFKPDVIFHLAGQVAMTSSIIDPRFDFEVNTLGTMNLLEAVRIHTPNAVVIYSSTNKVYGDLGQYTYREMETRYECNEQPFGFDEQTPLDFHSPYGCSKGAADQYILDYARIFGIRTIVFRHSSMYGGRQLSTYDQGWIGWFCQKALEAKKGFLSESFNISGNGKQVRDILHIEDIKKLYFAVVNQIDQVAGQVFNVGGGIDNSLSLVELFALLEGLLDVRLAYTEIPWRKSDQKVFIADIAKAKRLIEWVPEVTKDNGIEMTLNWMISEGVD
jgi:CDP-paratose 2-epimerase